MTPVCPAELILSLRSQKCPETIPAWPYFEASGAFTLVVRHPGPLQRVSRGCPEMTPVWPYSAPADLILGLRFQAVSRNDCGLALF